MLDPLVEMPFKLTTHYRYLYFYEKLKYNIFYYTLQKYISILTEWSKCPVLGAQWGWFLHITILHDIFNILQYMYSNRKSPILINQVSHDMDSHLYVILIIVLASKQVCENA